MDPRVFPFSIRTRLVLRHVDTHLSGDDRAIEVYEVERTRSIGNFSRRRPVGAIVRFHTIS